MCIYACSFSLLGAGFLPPTVVAAAPYFNGKVDVEANIRVDTFSTGQYTGFTGVDGLMMKRTRFPRASPSYGPALEPISLAHVCMVFACVRPNT